MATKKKPAMKKTAAGPSLAASTTSRQDYATPDDFKAAVERRFGPIVFDLAAHRMNRKAPSYFAPPTLTADVARGALDTAVIVKSLVIQGADPVEAREAVDAIRWAKVPKKKGLQIATVEVPNRDPSAAAFDALAQAWASIPGVADDGLRFLNPEFSHVDPWARKCALEGAFGAPIALLVTASVGSNWFRDHVAPSAEVYLLNARVCFDGLNVFPKDCMLAVWRGRTPSVNVWHWPSDTIHSIWTRTTEG